MAFRLGMICTDDCWNHWNYEINGVPLPEGYNSRNRDLSEDLRAMTAKNDSSLEIVPVKYSDPEAVKKAEVFQTLFTGGWIYEADLFRSTIVNFKGALDPPLEICEWHISKKTYLTDLQDRGVAVTPTRFIDGKTTPDLVQSTLVDWYGSDSSQWPEFVIVKPQMGATGVKLVRIETKVFADANPDELAKLELPDDSIIQEYVTTIQSHGEASLVYFCGKYIYSGLKKNTKDFRMNKAYGAQVLDYEPPADMIACTDNVERKVAEILKEKFGYDKPTPYMRIDILFGKEDHPYLVGEVEIMDPGLGLCVGTRCDQYLELMKERYVNQ